MYLAIIAGPNISNFLTDILFLTELQKRQTPKKGFAFIEKRYPNFKALIFISYRGNMKSKFITCSLDVAQASQHLSSPQHLECPYN
jgi:hypothetical protein